MTEHKVIYADEALRMIKNSQHDNPFLGTSMWAVWRQAHDCAISCVEACATAVAKGVANAKWQKQWCDSNMIGHLYEECPICSCMILDTEKFWDCKFCPNCGADMR